MSKMIKKHNEYLDKLIVGSLDDIEEIKHKLTEIYPRSHMEEHIPKEELIEIAIENLKSAFKALKLAQTIGKQEAKPNKEK